MILRPCPPPGLWVQALYAASSVAKWIPATLTVRGASSSVQLDAPGSSSGAAAAATASAGDPDGTYAIPKHRDKPALSQNVKFVDRLVVEVAGGKGGGGSAALFGRSGELV